MKKYILILMTIVSLFSCVPYISNDYGSDKISTFNYYCDQLDSHYVFTDLKGLTIDGTGGLRETYLAKISNDMSELAYFRVLNDFTNEFKDGHTNIIAPFAHSTYYPQIVDEAINYNKNYNYEIIKYNYLDGEILGSGLKYGVITSGGKKYGYLYYGSFMDSLATDLGYALNYFKGLEVSGVLLDIRGNGGGSISNAVTLLSYLGYNSSSEKTEFIKIWRRDGESKYTQIDGYDAAIGVNIPFTVERGDGGYTGPVALLTNKGCYSASSFAATGFLAFDNVRSFGTNTGGGMGLPYGGTLPNGWNYRLSSNIAMDVRATSYTDDQYNYEDDEIDGNGKFGGVPVDFYITDNTANNNSTTQNVGDEIIDDALVKIDYYNANGSWPARSPDPGY